MKISFGSSLLLVLFASTLMTVKAPAQILVTGGSATITVDEGLANGIGYFDAAFSDSATRAQTLSSPNNTTADATAGGGIYSVYDRLSGSPGTVGTSTTSGSNGTGVVETVDPIRPYDEVPLNDTGGTTPGVPGASRTRQATTLSFDSSNILGSWSSSNLSYGFVGNTTLGEQIAFTSIERYGGPFTGVLVYGDFGLRYASALANTTAPSSGELYSGLVLTSNIDFLNADFADLGNTTITFDNATSTLHITGDLLVGKGLNILDSSATIGEKFGTFDMVATVAAVPEPSTWVLMGAGLLLLGLVHRHRRKSSWRWHL